MRFLLDTHTFLWMAAEPTKLSTKVSGIVQASNNRLMLSAASGWEIALLWHLERVELPDQPQRFIPEALQKLSVIPLPIGFVAAISAATLPLIHHDPFDRIIIAEALKENVSVLTKDRRFADYGAHTLW
ncbi:MAG: type II toxin-antitoxin system VapC family toxin [Desulfobacterales bacterium]